MILQETFLYRDILLIHLSPIFQFVIDNNKSSCFAILSASSGTLKMNHTINEKNITYPADDIQKQNQNRDNEH